MVGAIPHGCPGAGDGEDSDADTFGIGHPSGREDCSAGAAISRTTMGDRRKALAPDLATSGSTEARGQPPNGNQVHGLALTG